MGERYTEALSRAVTRYLPIIAFVSSLYGASKICGIIVVSVTVLPYLLIGLASLTHSIPLRARLASIILYMEVILFIGVKYGFFNNK
ncbi:MAG: hypothetical protein GSR73_01200 [Desulfurococcales archaeon]|nr:hypothetical protein [Desulfurococcales archaeon]